MTFDLIVGALLHDIGKFAQRAGAVPDEQELGTIQNCCPSSQGEPSHLHGLYSARFVRELFGKQYPAAVDAVLYHHMQDKADNSFNARLIAIADLLSNGFSGQIQDSEHSAAERPTRLASIFSGIKGKTENQAGQYFPLMPLSGNIHQHMPQGGISFSEAEQYAGLWRHFSTEAKRIDTSDENLLIRQMLALLEKFTLFMPAGGAGRNNDVTLFHHLKTTAAITACLEHVDWQQHRPADILSALESGGTDAILDTPAFLLVGADLSGIQTFIYSVASKGALKGLRGRSIYLSVLVEIITESLLREIGLPPVNIIYCGGGHAYFLAPGTDAVRSLLLSKQAGINEFLIKAHHGRLSVVLAWQPMQFKDFLNSACAQVWDTLGARLAREKRRKAGQLMNSTESVGLILGPFPVKGEASVCQICGDDIANPSGQQEKCNLCGSFEHLSRDAARAKYIVMTLDDQVNLMGDVSGYTDILAGLGGACEFKEDADQTDKALLINSTSFLEENQRCLGFRFMGRHSPLSGTNSIATLEDLADVSIGIKKWGVLRADVDDLGRTMREGLKSGNKTIARLSVLSHMVNLFFGVQPQQIVSNDPYNAGVSLVYAGGDDLFAIGAWSLLPELADEINAAFNTYTGGAMTLSAGIFLAPSRNYPVHQAAAFAGSAETKAKDAGKKRLCYFESAFEWSRIGDVRTIQTLLVDLMKRSGNRKACPRSILSMLYAASEEQRMAREGKVTRFRVWRLFYALGRLKQRHKELAAQIQALEYKIIENLWMPAECNVGIRWAEYLTRGKERNQDE